MLANLDLDSWLIEDSLEIRKRVLDQSSIVQFKILLIELLSVIVELLLLVKRCQIVQAIRYCAEVFIVVLLKTKF